ncbi:MAG TPA: hypothetical protein VK929_11700 [Longimicrobiales bacterium]|nr:hypothetical protein [Longimicrobiales bacterium]
MLALSAVGSGCDGSEDARSARPADDPAPADTVTLTPGGAREVPPATERHFDPGSISVGDSLLGLVVREREVMRVFDDSVWAGRVHFAGEITVTGIYQRHFDWPEPDALCFHVDDSSVQAVPAFSPDSWTSANAKVWFCLTNPERAQALLGSGETPVRATVVVDDYAVLREFSDVFDTARLVRVEALEGHARPTLRDP